jgi:tetratricopeptide (TPR) repeat protein
MPSHLPGLAQQIAYYEQRLRRDPESRAFLALADLYRRASRHDAARELLEHGLARHPRFVSARAALGLVLAEMGEDGRARQELSAVLQVDPDHLLARRLLGREALRRERWAEACEHYEHLLRQEPEDAEVRRALREARDRLEQVAPRSAAAAAGEPATAAGASGGTADRSGRQSTAAAPEAGGLAVGNGFETPTLAELYLRQGHPEKAREILERILAADPERPDARDVLDRLQAGATDPASGASGNEPAAAEAAAGEASHPTARRDRPGPSRPGGREQDLERFRGWLERGGGGRDTAH